MQVFVCANLQEASDKDRYQASESHAQNLDILKHLERMEKQVEQLPDCRTLYGQCF